MTISIAQATAVNSSGPTNALDLKAFLTILTDQLKNQDPLKPMDNQEFVAQLAQFASLEQTRESNLKLDSLVSQQANTQVIGLLGRKVDLGGGETGTVSAISLQTGVPLMSVKRADNSTIPNVKFSQIISIL